MSASKNDQDLERAAIFIMSLTPDQASKVLTHMSPQQIQRLGLAMAHLKNVDPSRLDKVRINVLQSAVKHTTVSMNKDHHIRAVLSETLGQEKAEGLLDRILSDNSQSGMDALYWMEVDSIVELLKQEHPQIQTIILSALDSSKAAKVLATFDDDTQLELMLRMASQETIQSNAMVELNHVIESQLKNNASGPSEKPMNGAKKAADLINALGKMAEKRLLAKIQEKDEKLCLKLEDLMLIFEHLLRLSDKDMQLLLREAPSDKLVLALKGADPELREKIFNNMSKRAAELLKEDLETKGPVKLNVVESAQKDILLVARKMAEAGQIILVQKEEDGDMVA
jgi:flagellar motor switch protein FliG